ARRLLHAPGRSAIVLGCPSGRAVALCAASRVGDRGNPQRRRVWTVLERPHDRRIRRGHLAHPAVSGAVALATFAKNLAGGERYNEITKGAFPMTTNLGTAFLDGLAADQRAPEIPAASDVYGWLCGSWNLVVLRYGGIDVSSDGITAEVHAARVL